MLRQRVSPTPIAQNPQPPISGASHMEPVPEYIPNQAKFWREPALAGIEMLQATYRTYRFPPALSR